MAAAGVPGNIFSFNTLISACMKTGDVQRAHEVRA